MNLQYITDSSGQTTGVFIPINEWNDLKSRFKGIDQEGLEVPEWHKEVVRKRMELYKSNPDQALDFDAALDQIEKAL
ncbi:MAG: addiction module protein [Cyclobacteriaceae bacterium]|nr:addiction module protein [Cyclobacteriaceae bacterium]